MEKGQERKHEAVMGNRDAITPSLATKEAMSAATQEGNANVKSSGANLERMVTLKGKKAKITAL